MGFGQVVVVGEPVVFVESPIGAGIAVAVGSLADDGFAVDSLVAVVPIVGNLMMMAIVALDRIDLDSSQPEDFDN